MAARVVNVSEVNEDRNVSDMFDEGLQIFDNVSESKEPNNCAEIQGQINKAIKLLEEATKIVSLVGMFSTNESIEEVATNDVKFFLLPTLLGALTLKLCTSNRLEVVNTAEIYFRDFLKRCHGYGVINFGPPESTTNLTTPELAQNQETTTLNLVSKRNVKIQRYKDRKELEGKITLLRQNMQELMSDDDIKRDFHLALIKRFASEALEELDSIEAEKPIIEHLAKMRQDGTLAEQVERARLQDHPPSRPLRPIIITRDEMQKKIYGAGYPSLPTMTVQEFYDQRASTGEFPAPQGAQAAPLPAWAAEEAAACKSSHEEAELELRVEQDNEEELARKRAMDEYKDTHRRGDGNRMNRS